MNECTKDHCRPIPSLSSPVLGPGFFFLGAAIKLGSSVHSPISISELQSWGRGKRSHDRGTGHQKCEQDSQLDRQEVAPPRRSSDQCFQLSVDGRQSYLRWHLLIPFSSYCSPRIPRLSLLISDTFPYGCVFLEVACLGVGGDLWGPWFHVSALNGNFEKGRVWVNHPP